jgi:beta-galactosidase GanA
MKNLTSDDWRGGFVGLHPPKFISVLCFFIVKLLAAGVQSQGLDIPHLQRQGAATQLIVHGKPFLMLGGELGNSSASDLAYMKPIWPKLVRMHLNSVLVPVYWELLEPAEGKFDFTLVDSAIYSARQHDLKLVLLWFGSWKNSMSCYAPLWVKTDQRRFPRARTKDGKAIEILTPFNEENKNADARVFAALMKHLRAIDGKKQTVIMIQVENEIGMIPEARDYNEGANRAFAEKVPAELLGYLQKPKAALIPEFRDVWSASGFKSSGTWEEVFGKGLHTDEIFMAWHFAKYTNAVAQAGKKEYSLPMFVNAALIRPGYKPGQYPSAGPLPHLMDVWRAGAPQIDFLAPDIYFKSFVEWCEKYDRSGNPLFIPEVANNQSVANAFYAIAKHNAMGYSPFSIESLENPETNQISKGYEVLQQLAPLILANQGKGTMAGALLDSAHHQTQLPLGNFVFNVRHEYSWSYAKRTEDVAPRVGGLIIMLSPDEFLLAGSGIIITFAARGDDSAIAGIGIMEEGRFVDGKWFPGRRMNGDQNHQGRHTHLPGDSFSMQKVKLYQYK